MSSIEEDAFKRVQQMHSRVPFYSNNSQNRSQNRDVSAQNEKRPSENPPQTETISEQKHNDDENEKNVLDALFKNKDQSIILLLIILLMEENADSTLLFALMYLLL